ncbi:hypothetical protein VOLCADRAFT_99431 [Volvox carteri f. nagariensis]|uniref:Apple domain-containing protein n=1 Tax=Volvox carteri f. nagariensis TaxID=3068 RepID=D8UHS6_VOLCA|nr:uncharacterized protein VOLCADRAFT_99431 [Volvox carteri f. nagariensis]EFJ40736.1 hypothetical protein VOLCADRAFT_99431 [Volvox carteri f. nagariensis]|eukprot:XP_002958202.1 hypothetical protein VOLCADRAFT_99431 [Volvox carteri f. nagariensis]
MPALCMSLLRLFRRPAGKGFTYIHTAAAAALSYGYLAMGDQSTSRHVSLSRPLPSSPPPPPPPPFNNIAIGKTVYGSTQFSSQYAPVNAIDGIIPPAGSNSSTFISGIGKGEWLVIDFGEAMTISSIALYHRRDCCGHEVVNAEFSLGGVAIIPSDPTNYFYNYRLDNASSGPGTTGGVILLNLNPPRTGRTLLVRNHNFNLTPIAIAELQVYGMPAACTLQVLYGAGYGFDSSTLSTSDQPDEAACCQACYSSPTCRYWDYVRSSRVCRLKTDQGQSGQLIPGFFYPHQDRVAGAKRGMCICMYVWRLI